jgi:hypothetical protein
MSKFWLFEILPDQSLYSNPDFEEQIQPNFIKSFPCFN